MDDDDDLIVNGLPQLSPICVTISRRYILEEAIRQIRGTLHSFELVADDANTVMASVKIELPSHSKDIPSEQRLFYGEPTQLGPDAIESASAAALAYLLDMKIITIDDANYANLRKCQKLLQAEQFWSSMLHDHAKSFQNDLASRTTKKEEPSSNSGASGPLINKLVADPDAPANNISSPMTNEEALHHKPDRQDGKKTKLNPPARRALDFHG